MSFGKFGAKPRGMSNPIYWVNQHLQQQRRDRLRLVSIDRFNERWHRLESIDLHLKEWFIKPLNGYEVDGRIAEKLGAAMQRAAVLHSSIAENINTCAASELSKYATSLKNLALISVGLCVNLGVYDDIQSFGYNVSERKFLINGEVFYHLG